MSLSFNILSVADAQTTLELLTGVPYSIYYEHEGQFEYADDLIADIAKRCGHLPPHYQEWDFIYTHITTSSTHCDSFRRHGIMDLVQSYSCPDSELRSFLDSNGLFIDLSQKQLLYKDKSYDISYTYGEHVACSSFESERMLCRAIGRKFFFDFASCGFLSVWDKHPYGGRVHTRPEILQNIDDLLSTNFSAEWESTHKPYEVVARVKGSKILYDGDPGHSNEENDISYLAKAYYKALGDPSETVLILRDHVSIPPTDIIDIKPLSYWKL